MARGVRALLLVAALIVESRCKSDSEALVHTAYKNLITRRLIAKREIKCNQDEYNFGVQCCKKCESGFVKNTDCPTDTSKHCVPCENGKEYIDHANDVNKCLRCSSCDSIFGLEVAKNCTPAQNTECTCAEKYFCNSSVPCRHCEPCSICESGVIVKKCTPTSDTVCGKQGSTGVPWWAILLIVLSLLAVLLLGIILWYRSKQNSLPSKENQDKGPPKQEPSYEDVPLINTDVDLGSHIAAIVEEMTLQDIKTFVRNHKVPEPIVDQTVRDYSNDTAEQKFKLFQVWYQRHGLKGAYVTLISSLRDFKMCTAADKIEKKLQAAVASCQEGGQPCNDDTEESQTCTQEGRNSYSNSAELSRACSGSLEETHKVT